MTADFASGYSEFPSIPLPVSSIVLMRIILVLASLAAIARAVVLRQVPSGPQSATPTSRPVTAVTPSAAQSMMPSNSAAILSSSQTSVASQSTAAPATQSTSAPAAPGGDLTTTANGAVNSPPYTVPINPSTFFWTSVSIPPGVSTIHM
ncbi:hypothetical protein F5I97DRAFT_1884700 [Phlebopus sp. FC_14]|nr:hypothetical protein F5I97DRAFT_1884700 [Phlebopus sp. FC_14]